ncbi:MAG TPA: VOC family protein [Acidimicrobiia bacterium]|nr:VOC family protein [Acidimicrobiia bacterium]
MAHSVQITFACEDPARMAEFWSEALGYIEQPPPSGFETWDEFADSVGIPELQRNDLNAVVDPDGVGPRILFERWDAGEPNKRVHIDLNVIAGIGSSLTPEERQSKLDEERARLEELGAAFHRTASGMAGETWIEMFDPEGNWFCVQ